MRVGLVSDSHGLFDPGLPALLARCDLILHAGDVGKPAVLAALEGIAPVHSVRGNVDEDDPALGRLPATALVRLGELTALVVHDLGAPGRPKPPARALVARERPDVVVHGHSHRPGAEIVEGRLYANPGSAGPRRFSLPRTAAILEVHGRRVRLRWIDLAAAGAPFGGAVEASL